MSLTYKQEYFNNLIRQKITKKYAKITTDNLFLVSHNNKANAKNVLKE